MFSVQCSGKNVSAAKPYMADRRPMNPADQVNPPGRFDQAEIPDRPLATYPVRPSRSSTRRELALFQFPEHMQLQRFTIPHCASHRHLFLLSQVSTYIRTTHYPLPLTASPYPMFSTRVYENLLFFICGSDAGSSWNRGILSCRRSACGGTFLLRRTGYFS